MTKKKSFVKNKKNNLLLDPNLFFFLNKKIIIGANLNKNLS